jgi:monofunctional biosynthetic peptidoglycan transglycosylase
MHQVRLCDSDPGYTRIKEISPYIIGAVLMSEDAAFYSHQGIDYDELKESLIRDLNEGRFARGASTITQQLAKNAFTNGEKSIFRKAQEIYLTFEIEKLFTKAKILEMYLNIVEFGDNIYGVRAAAQYYFNTTPGQLTPEQGAFLAFLLPNPKKYSQSFQKRQLSPFAYKTVRTILHKMLQGHKITDGEYESAVARMGNFPWQGGPTSAVTAQPQGPNPPPVVESAPGEPVIPEDDNQEGDEFKFDFDTSEPSPLPSPSI